MNLSTYSSSTVFSMVIVALIIITLLADALHYLARRRVKRAMTRMTLANDIMKEGIGMSDHLIVALDLKENRFYNLHDERLPETGISYDDVKRLVHPDHRDIYQNFIEGLRYDEKHEDVQTEWQFAELISRYMAFKDADAIGYGALANASFWQHFPLKST